MKLLQGFIFRMGRLVLLDRAADPTANGHIQRNATHIKAFTGGGVKNLTDIAKLHATEHQPGGIDPMAVDAAAATGSLRTLGTTSLKAATGDHLTPSMTATLAGHVPTPPNDAAKYLDGTGAFTTPPGTGGASPSKVMAYSAGTLGTER